MDLRVPLQITPLKISIANKSNKMSVLNMNALNNIPTGLPKENYRLDNYYDTSLNLNYLSKGSQEISGILLDNKSKPIPYSPVYLYSSTSGQFIQSTSTLIDGSYSFINLRPNYSYMVVSTDKTKSYNATVLEFTLKEETNE